MLRAHFAEHGEVLVFGDGSDKVDTEHTSMRGTSSPNYEVKYTLTKEHCDWVAKHVDEEHMLGRTITNGSLRAAVLNEFGFQVQRSSLLQ